MSRCGHRLCAALFVVACLLLACGKTQEQVIAENAPAFAAKRTELAAIAGALPAAGSVKALQAAKVDPPAVYDKNGAANMDILMAEQLRDPDAEPQLDLLLSHELLSALQWTGPKNPMASTALGTRNPKLDAELKHALGLRYLGVVRVVHLDPPVASGERFTGGDLQGEVFVVDVPAKKVLASGRFEAHPLDTVKFEYRKGEDPNEAAKRFIRSTVWESARAQVKKTIEQAIGTTVTLD